MIWARGGKDGRDFIAAIGRWKLIRIWWVLFMTAGHYPNGHHAIEARGFDYVLKPFECKP